jgi:hypothetical protein
MPIIVAILAVVIVGLGAALYFIPSDSASTPAPVPVNETIVQEANRTEEMQAAEEMTIKNDPVPTPQAATAAIAYTENTSYLTPARTEHKMAVTLTVADGVVTDASVTYDGQSSGFSNPNHERFDAAYKTEVIGKKLSEVSLSRVGGASLTSKAFNEAVAKIVAQQS